MSAAGHGDGHAWEQPAGTPGPDDYAAAIGALDDPLNDPLPGPYGGGAGPSARADDSAARGAAADPSAPPAGSAPPGAGSGRRRRPAVPESPTSPAAGGHDPLAGREGRPAGHEDHRGPSGAWQGPGPSDAAAPLAGRPGGGPHGGGPAARGGAGHHGPYAADPRRDGATAGFPDGSGYGDGAGGYDSGRGRGWDGGAAPGRGDDGGPGAGGRPAGHAPGPSGYAEPVFPSSPSFPSQPSAGTTGPGGLPRGTTGYGHAALGPEAPGGHAPAGPDARHRAATPGDADPATAGQRQFPDSGPAARPPGSGRRRKPPAAVPDAAEDATAVMDAIPAAPVDDGAGDGSDRRGTASSPYEDATADAGEGSLGTAPAATADGPVPGGRLARRKAERLEKATRANKIANVFGEVMITTGVLMMLFVTYQLWWTNVEARAHANSQVDALLDQWDSGTGGGDGDGASEGEGEETAGGDEDGGEVDTSPGVFSPGDGFALLHLPTIGVRVPIAEGVDPASVLDRGMVGRYSAEDGLPTAMPWDAEGNMGLAAHRNTHGEPFRYINRINPGEPIVVETESTYYVYEMRSRLDSTSPAHVQVLDPVPDSSGFEGPGRYITLTTCTPEFTSTYRLIVWGEMVSEQPRSDGKPDALLN